MAKGKKTGGRNFVKGQVANPKGRPPLPDHLKKARRFNKGMYEEIANKYMYKTVPELVDALKQGGLPLIEVCVIKCLMDIAKNGNMGNLDKFLDRMIGKVKDVIEHSGSLHGSIVNMIEDESEQK